MWLLIIPLIIVILIVWYLFDSVSWKRDHSQKLDELQIDDPIEKLKLKLMWKTADETERISTICKYFFYIFVIGCSLSVLYLCYSFFLG